ncbi:hypothetical protein [Pseudoleptotrichia goodfellowii]|uniref:Uncharacterized protein n=1 Tax=Pseudoleptotrichia goodfellowii TaxID=157692 RepID=A0A510J864_9FUSO|nr:hypothetical protein [Pseudoleptotrichia goodfellowii]BBM35438.1 hypothetical protein JCM16774_0351 [Pseudoleptotrichia goodfellowii]
MKIFIVVILMLYILITSDIIIKTINLFVVSDYDREEYKAFFVIMIYILSIIGLLMYIYNILKL